MKKTLLLSISLIILNIIAVFSQGIDTIFPPAVASHTATQNGNWNIAATWGTDGIPAEGAMVYVPIGITVDYNSTTVSNPHIFIIRIDGTFNINAPITAGTTQLKFDTLITGMMSNLNITANITTDRNINLDITPYDIMGNPLRTSWSTAQQNQFKDNSIVKKFIYSATGDDRHENLSQANSSLDPLTITRTPDGNWIDGIGVVGRYNWDPNQISLGVMTMGNVNIIGLEKTNMVKLQSDANKNDFSVTLKSTPTNWKNNDEIIITSGGNHDATQNGEDLSVINGDVNSTTVNVISSLLKNHHGRPAPKLSEDLHCYVGNLTRTIVFNSPTTTRTDERGHFMAMNTGNNPDVSIKNASFNKMGRTDKSIPVDDFYFKNWLEPGMPISKVSTLGIECAEMQKAADDEITNSRGRYSIHLHKLGAEFGSKMAQVTGNVVRDNPGWGITQHDSHANVSNNVVYDVVGAAIVSETGSETGVWDHNLTVNTRAGHGADVYESSLYYDDILFSGVGLGMKGRSVHCKNNVVTDAVFGLRIINFNNSISNLDRVDAKALATTRIGFEADNFPLSVNGYSKYGDGVIPLQAALIMENTTIIDCKQGMKSIERDMGVNHESRSIFDGFIAWGVNTGLGITYQADYSYYDVYVSGRGGATNLGIDLWKHSHNHIFKNVTLENLEYGIKVSKIVHSNNASTEGPKVRNNGFTPWLVLDLDYSNSVTHLYKLEIDNPTKDPGYVYEQCTDNTLIMPSSDFTTRPTTFTQLTSSELDYTSTGTNALRFTVDGIISDDLGTYNMGIQQSLAQGTLRFGYPERIYQFASQTKFKEYLTNNGGVYKDEANGDQLYFILNENLPNRLTHDYTTFPVKVKIINAPNEAPFNTPQVESANALLPKNQIISRFATVTQSSTAPNIMYNDGHSAEGDKPVNFIAQNTVDGNNNGRVNVNYYQRTFVPFIGSQSRTNVETQPWYELDFGEEKMIDYFDIWNTVELPVDGQDQEILTPGFTNFYVFISDTPFSSMSAQDTATLVTESDYNYLHNGVNARKVSQDNVNVIGRYMRIQSNEATNVSLKLAEVEVIGRKSLGTLSTATENEIKNITVYPNPTTGKVTINFGQTYKTVNFKILNILGQTVYNNMENNVNKTAFTFNGTSGVYFLEIKTGDKTKVIKLVKK